MRWSTVLARTLACEVPLAERLVTQGLGSGAQLPDGMATQEAWERDGALATGVGRGLRGPSKSRTTSTVRRVGRYTAQYLAAMVLSAPWACMTGHAHASIRALCVRIRPRL
jgi:hypothetical protein